MNQSYGSYGNYGSYGDGGATAFLIAAIATGIERAVVTKKEKCKRVGTSRQKPGDVQACREIGMEAPALQAQRAQRDSRYYQPPTINNAAKAGAAASSPGCPPQVVPLDAGKYGIKLTPGGNQKKPYSVAGKLYYLTDAAVLTKTAELEAACGGSGSPEAKAAQAGAIMAAGEATAASWNPTTIILGVGTVALVGFGIYALTQRRGRGRGRLGR